MADPEESGQLVPAAGALNGLFQSLVHAAEYRASNFALQSCSGNPNLPVVGRDTGTQALGLTRYVWTGKEDIPDVIV
jgi:hypothetical protein